MKTIKAFIKRHPLCLGYFALAFAISWGGILIVVGLGPGGFSAPQVKQYRCRPVRCPRVARGPSVAGILDRPPLWKTGLRELRPGLLRWRVGVRWYAVALLTAPLMYVALRRALAHIP